MKKEMNTAERFVEENLEGVLSEYDDEDLKKTDGRTLATELTEDFDSILLARVEDDDLIEMAKRLGQEKGDKEAKSFSDANEARFYLLAEVARVVARKVSAWDKKGTSNVI